MPIAVPNWFLRHSFWIVAIAANGVAAVSGNALAMMISDPGDAERLIRFWERFPLWLVVLSNAINFGVPILLLAWYTAPVIRSLNDPAGADERARRVVLNAPLVVALTGLLGWMLSVAQSFVFQMWSFPGARWSFMLLGLVLTGMLGLGTFVLIYYSLEFLARRTYIPLFFPDGRLSDVRGALHLSVLRRFAIFYMAVGIIPIGFLLLAYRAASARLPEGGMLFEVVVAGVAFLVLGAILTLLFARAYQGPLVAMKRAVDGLRSGDFDVPVPVLSHDELGHLGEGLRLAARELKDKEFIKESFGRMVDPEVRDHLLAGNLKLGGELRSAVLLYSDIRGFTALSEQMRPDELVSLLNRYFEKMSECIKATGGFVNRFIGDAILAVFNIPLQMPRPADAALECALAMRHELEQLNTELAAESIPRITIGIGIHAGEVLAGNIGSTRRMEYTVIGDAVNVTARLEGLTKEYACDILISGAAREALEEPEAYEMREVASVQVRGRAQPVVVSCLNGKV